MASTSVPCWSRSRWTLGERLVGAAAQADHEAQPGVALQGGEHVVQGLEQVGEAVGLVQRIEDQPHAPVRLQVVTGRGLQVAEEVVQVGEGAAGDAGRRSTASHRVWRPDQAASPL